MNNHVDSYIIANFKLIGSSLGIACVATGAVAVFLSIPLIGTFVALPLSIVAMYQIYCIMKKLYYESTFGNDAYLYKSLPVSPSQEIYCKILTGGIALLLQGVSTMVCFSLYYVLTGLGKVTLLNSFLQGYIERGVESAGIPLYVSLDFLAAAVGAFAQVAVLFLVITMYNYMDAFQKTRNKTAKYMAVGLGAVLQLLLTRFPERVFDTVGLTASIAAPAGSLVMYAAVLVGSVIWTVKLYEEKYQIA